MVDTKAVGKAAVYVVIVFTAVGIGLGLSGYLSVGAAHEQFVGDSGGGGFGEAFVAIILLQSSFTMFLLGPVVAATAGLLAGVVSTDKMSAIVGGGLGTFVGFYIMVTLGVVIMASAVEMGSGGGSGGGSGSFDGLIRPLVGAGIPTTVVGAAMSLVGSKI